MDEPDTLVADLVASRARSNTLGALGLVLLCLLATVSKLLFEVLPTLLFVALTLPPVLVSAVCILGVLVAMKQVLVPIPDAAGIRPAQRIVPVAAGTAVIVLGSLLIVLNSVDFLFARFGAGDEVVEHRAPDLPK